LVKIPTTGNHTFFAPFFEMKDFTQKVTVKINIFFLHFILAFHTNAKKIKIAAKDLLILLYEVSCVALT
tara:strand:- start:91 stop:297 length:207 start_codon:yes stop_codon:yes gene_type:complete